MSKTGVLLVNLGTPDSYEPADVKRYLLEFLLDGRVIDLPFIKRNFLVRSIIVPRRYKNSAKNYKEIWTDKGSPLKLYTEAAAEKLSIELGDGYLVEVAMRYQNPSIPSALEKLQKAGVKKIVVLALFPQYASATTGSVHQRVMEVVKGWQVIPDMVFINNFYDDENFLTAFTEIGKKYDPTKYDHIIFSFHGLPERQIFKADANNHCLKSPDCCQKISEVNQFCYRAQCFATARLLTQRLKISPEKYTVCFQSRLGKDPWIRPYADETLEKLAREGVKHILAFSPAFIADCLETIYEIGVEYDEEFREMGGEKVQLVESLNDHPLWVKTLKGLVVGK